MMGFWRNDLHQAEKAEKTFLKLFKQVDPQNKTSQNFPIVRRCYINTASLKSNRKKMKINHESIQGPGASGLLPLQVGRKNVGQLPLAQHLLSRATVAPGNKYQKI